MSGFYIFSCSIWAFLHFAKAEVDSDTNVLESSTSYTAIMAIVGVSVITLAVICWTLTFFCTDCYNAEVDSTSHPACQSSGIGVALSSQAVQEERLDLNNKYSYGPPNQQPLHFHQYQPPASNVPPQYEYSNLTNNSYCSNMHPKPSAPNRQQDAQGYQNYHNAMRGYNHQTPLSTPYPNLSWNFSSAKYDFFFFTNIHTLYLFICCFDKYISFYQILLIFNCFLLIKVFFFFKSHLFIKHFSAEYLIGRNWRFLFLFLNNKKSGPFELYYSFNSLNFSSR